MLWNVDDTLVDVARVARAARAEAFAAVTGLPLVALPQFAGRTESEIFFEAVALNAAGADGRELLQAYFARLAAAFAARSEQLTRNGRALPGALDAVMAVRGLGAVQSVLTGSTRANAVAKLAAFGLDRHLDLNIGGYGSDVYPKGAQLLEILRRAAEKYRAGMPAAATVYIGDSARDAEAAELGGVRFIGVATGRSIPSELRAAGADLVVDDLTDTAAVVEAIDRLTAGRATAPRLDLGR